MLSWNKHKNMKRQNDRKTERQRRKDTDRDKESLEM